MKPTVELPKIKSDIHFVIEKRDNGEYLYPWSDNENEYDKDTFEYEYITELEKIASQLKPFFNQIGIEPCVLNGAEAGFEFEVAVICLDDIGNDDAVAYGHIMVTDEGFEWRKSGFSPIPFKDANTIVEWINFLQHTKWPWLETIRGEKTMPVFVLDNDYTNGPQMDGYTESPLGWIELFRKNFIYPHSYAGGHLMHIGSRKDIID